MSGLAPDFPRPDRYLPAKDSLRFELGREVTGSLIRVCGNSELLILSALIAGLKVCLFKYHGIEDVIIGTSIHHEAIEVAPLNRVLALRDRVTGDSTLRQLLPEVKRTLAEAYSNQKFSFERILDLLNIPILSNRAPLFDAVVILDKQNNRQNVAHLKTDVTMIFSPKQSNPICVIEYNPSLFKRTSIELFVEHYARVLQTVLENPNLTFSEVDLLTPEKRLELLDTFNSTETEYPGPETIHELIEEQAEKRGEREAVVSGEEAITYRELNERANQLGRYLRRKGAGRGKLVGVYMEHSIETVVGLVGVLKSGAGYVPIDVRNPKGRVRYIIEDAGIEIVVTKREEAERLEGIGVEKILMDEERREIEEEGKGNIEEEVRKEDLAYVIYTSGSTGHPKGVKVRHSSLVNYIRWAKETYIGEEELDFAMYSSIGFDLTVTSIYTPLISGSRVIVYGDRGEETPLKEVMREGRAGVVKLTPSHLRLIKDEDNRGRGIKKLIVGGEALRTELAREVSESFGGEVEIYNEYGPTEATVGCMIHRYDSERDERGSVPIGRPAANTKIYLLDEKMRPVAENMMGEICIGGECLAEGYWGREELSKEKFIENPFKEGERIYRSGDVGRWLREGEVEYIGRRDEQVKYHGHRVELGEIAAAVKEHGEVREAVVMIRKEKELGEVMVCYYVSREEIESGELREFVKERVIEETVPGMYVHMKRMPLTLNGKVDVRVLPGIEEVRGRKKERYEEARGPVEEVIAGIWGEVLGLERVGVTESFFEMGGHSLLATQVVSRVREVMKVEIGLRKMFEKATVRGLAEEVERQMRE